ncbi:MAG: ADP-ribosylglycohydrolase family protein [Cellulosilyticum sp.]|nr:ADP-ribosylglycohydrolase family protein [Cellulosilyticum sp.]
MKHAFPYFYGALLGGAIGDALGAPIEFMRFEQVMGILGETGVTDYIIPPGHKHALVTDDTQLMLFTAEGLIRSATRAHRKNKERTLQGIAITVFRAYLRWLYTQGLQTARWSKKDYDGWLVKVSRMHAYRDPGVTCLTTLGKGVMGTLNQPISENLGCGCVMRVVPVGLVEESERVFDIAIRLAAITHGNPTAYLSAGTLAYIIHEIIEDQEIEKAVYSARDKLSQEENSKDVIEKIDLAIKLVQEGNPSREKIEQIGKGLDAHEVLAMAIYAALSYPQDYLKGVLLGINHSGASDSVGGITGCILGGYLGIHKIPTDLAERVELHKEIKELATDLLTFYQDGEAWLTKYPAW